MGKLKIIGEKIVRWTKPHERTLRTYGFFLMIATLVGSSNFMNLDEGIILNGAWKMYLGQSLYTDFFEIIAPGSFVLAFVTMKLFAPTYIAVRIVAILMLALSSFALADIAKRLGVSERGARIAGVVWMIFLMYGLMLISHNAWSSEITIIGLALLLRAIDRKLNWISFALAGLTLGLVPVFHQTKGPLLLGTLVPVLLYFVLRRIFPMQNMVAFCLGAAIPAVVTFLVWSPTVLWEHLVAWPLAHYFAVNEVSFIPFVIVLIVSAALMYSSWKSASTVRPLLLLIIVSQLALFLSVYSRPDFEHIAMDAFAIPIFVLLLLEAREKRVGKISPKKSLLPEPLVLILLFVMSFNITFSMHTPKTLAHLREYQDTYGQGIYNYPFIPSFYFELRAPNPYPYGALLTGMHTPDEFNKNLDILKREKPPLVIRYQMIGNKFGYNWNNPHDIWINEHYRVVQDGGLEVLLRNDIEFIPKTQ